MNCAKCGKTATKTNDDGVPVCSSHSKAKVSAPLCPECGLGMEIRKGKFGSFWGCIAYPSCSGIKKL